MRLAAADVAALAANLREELVGLRVNNVYDCLPTPMSPNSYALKLSGTAKNASSGASSAAKNAGDEEAGTTKALLVIDAPMRVHTTAIARPRKETVSVFTLQLRKHLRGKRLENVEQLGVDRVLRLSFGTGDSCFYVIVELYAQGNVLLADAHNMLIAVMRKHDYGEDVGVVASKKEYPMSVISRFPDPNTYSKDALKTLVDQMVTEHREKCRLAHEAEVAAEAEEAKLLEESRLKDDEESENKEKAKEEDSQKGKKGKGNKGQAKKQKQQKQQAKKNVPKVESGIFVRDVVRKFLDGGSHWMRIVIDRSGIDYKRNLAETEALTESELQKLSEAISFGFDWLAHPSFQPAYVLLAPVQAPAGDSSSTQVEQTAEQKAEARKQRFYDFIPGDVLHEGCGVTDADCCDKFDSLNLALDSFFTAMEMRALEKEHSSVEKNLEKKHEKFLREQEARRNGLQNNASRMERGAQLIQYNVELVEQIIVEMRTLVSSGMQWAEIERTIKALKKKDPMSIANIIHSLQLEKNMITILLSEPYDDDEAEVDAEQVQVDFTVNAQANATRLYTQRSAVLSKMRKMEAVSDEVQKRAEKKHERDIHKTVARKQVDLNVFNRQVRKKFWFEKFDWFISSENFVVVSGRDMQQNEMLFRRYMKENDLYIHADIHGAATCIIRNPDARPIGASTLEQAGRHSMCHSSAWSAKLVTSAWWVRPAQVTKSAPSGEYLSTGSFMIRGKKNFLPPHELVLGFGILFLLDPVSIPNHEGERMPNEETLSSAIPVFSESSTEKEELKNASYLPALSGESNDWDSMMSSRLDGEEEEEEEEEAKDDDEENDEQESEAPTSKDEKPAVASQSDIIASVFGLKKEADTTLTAADGESETTQTSGKQRISAHERKAMKKKQKALKNGEKDETVADVGEEEKEVATKPKKQPAERKPATATVEFKQAKKMSKAKARRMRKYADEDDEEREIRLMLIGQKKPEPKKIEGEKNEAAASTAEPGKKNVCFICGSSKHYARDCPMRDQAKSAASSTDKPAEEPADDLSSDSEGEKDADADGKSGTSGGNELNRLTGSPKSDDVLLYAIPVCAPYEALKNYKYKVKLTPGHLKRSKAVQSSLAVFMKQSDATAQERRLIQAIPESELTQTMPSDVTVAGSQASARLSKKGGKK